MTKKVLEVKNLVKKYKDYKALNGISFDIKEGEIVGLLGPNGAGKTTTIQILLSVLTPTSGSIYYFGKEFTKNREEILKQVNFCSSYIRLPWSLTVEENLDVVARLYEVGDRKKRISKVLEIFEMTDFRKRQMNALSAGETMRVILAKSFINYPKVLLLDEPTASLDPEIAQKVREFLRKEREEFKMSMLFTSHNMAEVEEICDRVIFLHEGKILTVDTPEGLAKKIDIAKVELLLGEEKDEAVALCRKNGWETEIDGRRVRVKIKEKEIPELLSTLGQANISYSEITIDNPTLEDFFIKVAKEGKY